MNFSNWLILNFLFIPAGILVWVWRTQRAAVAMPWDFGRQKSGWFWSFAIKCMQSIPVLLMAIAIILLAGPRNYSIPKTKRKLTNIEFCLDLSGSMNMKFGSGTRYDAAMEALNKFIEFRQGNDAFGLTIFGDTVHQWIPLTSDTSAFRCATPFLDPRKMPAGFGGGTMIGKALRECHRVLEKRNSGDRMIVLVSDGASADLGNGEEEIIARELKSSGIVLYGVHIGGGNVPPEVASMATITGGGTFSAGDEVGLENIFRKIDSMQVAEFERSYAELLDFFWPFCGLGAALMLIYLMSLFGLRFTPW